MTSKESQDYLWNLVQRKAQQGDGDAANILGSLYVDRALEEKDSSLLDLAEKNFVLAASLGSAAAAAFVEAVWPSVKLEYLAKIQESLGDGAEKP